MLSLSLIWLTFMVVLGILIYRLGGYYPVIKSTDNLDKEALNWASEYHARQRALFDKESS